MTKEEQWKREAEIKLDELDDRGFDFDNWSISDAYERGYCDCAEPREKRIEELEKENTELKSECRRCVYADCPCILSDYDKDKNEICDHFKDVFDENAELKREIDEAEIKCIKGECPRFKTLENIQLSKAKKIIGKLLIRLANFTYTGLDCEECKQAEQFLKEIEK